MKTDYIWQITIVGIGALISSVAGYIIGSQPEKILKLEYEVFNNENISRNLAGIENVEILHNGEKIEKLSNTTILVRNSSPKNLEDIRIHFVFPDSQTQPIFTSTHTPKDRPKESVSLAEKTDNKYSYLIDDINIAKNDFDGYLFTFHFASEKPPLVNVLTSGKGITIEENLNTKPTVMSYFYNAIYRSWWLLLIYILVVLLYTKFVSSQSTLRKQHIENMASKDRAQLDAEDIIALTKFNPKARDVLKHTFRKTAWFK
ncbi:hypothetical protein MPL1_08843 [Methylophaga lonarensis MPL]|uniref:Uncharacterized protein n=1 Tax=Methylophaga lonarensis MPL TaxID=1286106 RepID=M7NVD1_9GAMM|nr:hypothetical protein [Methylophaga lonarensis]EMR12713.1 hypothetical protein MPL1_08843 [Methylophaga lonarensis MPL]